MPRTIRYKAITNFYEYQNAFKILEGNDSDLREFSIYQTLPRFSPCETGWRKAQESFFFYSCRSEFNIIFPLEL